MSLELIQTITFAFGALFPVVNPIGSSVIVLSIAGNASPAELRVLALKIALYTACLLITVLFCGSWILSLFGITIPVVLIGGGLVLAYIGWQLLNASATSNPEKINVESSDQEVNSLAFYPLTMPVTAGPGCIAVAIALGAHSLTGEWNSTLINQLANSIGILLVSLTVFICYRYTYLVTHKLGAAGTQVIMRLAAFINLCIGLQLIVHGVKLLGN